MVLFGSPIYYVSYSTRTQKGTTILTTTHIMSCSVHIINSMDRKVEDPNVYMSHGQNSL